MKTIFKLTLKSAARDPFLLFWSILMPMGAATGLGLMVKSPEYPNRILTGMIGISILFFALMTTAYYIMGQRRRGVYHLLRVTPMPLWKYVFSVSSAWTLIGLFCGALILLTGSIVLNISISMISFFMLVPIMVLGAIGYVFLSFFVSSLSGTESHISIFTNLLAFPLMFSSDAFYSLEAAPQFIQRINQFNPFQWFLNGLRSAMALDRLTYLPNMILLLIVVFVTLALAVRTFRFTS